MMKNLRDFRFSKMTMTRKWLTRILILQFSIFTCHVDFINSIRYQHLVIVEITCIIFDLCHKE